MAYVDGNRGRRPVAHRLSFVEMVVPYGDPNDPHYRKNAFDAGEDGLGKNAHSLKRVCFLLVDCVDIQFFGVTENPLLDHQFYSLIFCHSPSCTSMSKAYSYSLLLTSVS